jgi:hypothetical protein
LLDFFPHNIPDLRQNFMRLFEVALLSFGIENPFFDTLNGMVVNLNIIFWLGSRHSNFVNSMGEIKVMGDVMSGGIKRVSPTLDQDGSHTVSIVGEQTWLYHPS